MTDKSHLLRFGYAPGNYWFVCPDCGDKQAVGDKRATRCEACAEGLHAQITSVEAVADKHRAMTTVPEEAVKADALRALDRFSFAAQQWGWQADQGSNDAIINDTKAEFDASYAALECILSALGPSAARKLALEEAARLCETHIETIGRTRALEYHNPLNGEKHSGMTYAAAIRALSSPDHADAGKLDAVTICKKLAPYLGATEANDWTGLKDDDAISLTVKLLVGDLRTLKAVATDEADAGKVEGDGVERKFQLGDRVTKNKGASWTGRVVGFYSTELTPTGYAVESETEIGSVQIYPEAALRPFPSAPSQEVAGS